MQRSPEEAVDAIHRNGHRRVYVDGGATICRHLAVKLVDELPLSHVPVVIGDGPSLFDLLGGDAYLEHVRNAVLDHGMVQITYRVLGGPTPHRIRSTTDGVLREA